jgi:monovalent cation:H+ antiporter, CPA1 family
MPLYSALAVLLSICAVCSYINHRWLRLPATIGIMVLSLCLSALVIGAGSLYPTFERSLLTLVRAVDFGEILLNVLLPPLLFAGSIQINVAHLRKHLFPVALLATVGTLLSTAFVAFGMWAVFALCGISLPFLVCTLFGAIISPTDPVAVLGMLRRAHIGPSLELKIAGESLFNDGVGVVIFVTLLHIGIAGWDSLTSTEIVLLFLQEAVGGLLLGAALGLVAAFLLRSIDDYSTEVLITIALVAGGYTLAGFIHVSGPLAMVVAGIIVGSKGRAGTSDVTRDYLDKFWHLIDEALNALLFLLVGFQILLLQSAAPLLLAGACAILVVLIARLCSVAIPVRVMRWLRVPLERNVVLLLTWAGLRGGLSLAMALSVPESLHRDTLVTVTYCVVVFSIIIQGLTIEKFATWLRRRV